MSFSSLLLHYKQQFEFELEKYFTHWGDQTLLTEACKYAVQNGGKRFRPALVMMIASALGNGTNVFASAIAIEFFHCSSLIADDLPCMDNDDLRRGKPTVHKVYGESTALLASYTLISAGYECICNNKTFIKTSDADIRTILAIKNATHNTGICGIQVGQFLDLNPPEKNIEMLFTIANKKTAALFEVAFVFGWLFGGGKIEMLDQVKLAAQAFGLSFQIADDLEDYLQDLSKEQMMNIVAMVGKEKALELFYEKVSEFEFLLQQLNLSDSPLKQIMALLSQQAEQRAQGLK